MDQDEIDDLWKNLVSAEVQKQVNQNLLQTAAGIWLESEINTKLRSVIVSKRTGNFIYLTPQQWLDWYAQLFSAIIGIAVLGAGFTFGLIFSELQTPSKNDKLYVRRCIAASWMLFVLSLGWASLTALVLSVNRTFALKRFGTGMGLWREVIPICFTISILLGQLLPVGAFVASAEAMRQYHNGLGITTLALLGVIGVIVILAWMGQNM